MSGIVRIEHDKDRPYVVVSKSLTNDKRLSFRLRGMLTYLLGKPQGWQARMNEIQDAGTESEDAVRSMFAEGRRFGYIKTIARRIKGRMSFEHVIYESPLATPCPDILNEDGTVYVAPTKRGKPGSVDRTGETELGFPSLETRVLVSNEASSTQSANKERESAAPNALAQTSEKASEPETAPNTTPADAGPPHGAAVRQEAPSPVQVQTQVPASAGETNATSSEKVPGAARRGGRAVTATEAFLRRKLSGPFVDRLFDELQPLGVERRTDWPALPLDRVQELVEEAQRTHQRHGMKVPTRLRDLLDEECRRTLNPLPDPVDPKAPTSASAAAPVSKYDRSAWSD